MADTVDDLLSRAFTDPAGAIESASPQLASASGPERVELLRVLGTACRELRRVDDSVRYLRAAVRDAAELGDATLEGRCSMSLAASLSYSGDFDESLRIGRRATELLVGDDRIAATSQLAGLQQRAGHNEEALRGFGRALQLAEQSTDESIRGHLLVNRGVL